MTELPTILIQVNQEQYLALLELRAWLSVRHEDIWEEYIKHLESGRKAMKEAEDIINKTFGRFKK